MIIFIVSKYYGAHDYNTHRCFTYNICTGALHIIYALVLSNKEWHDISPQMFEISLPSGAHGNTGTDVHTNYMSINVP
jgi:hypothetical protein